MLESTNIESVLLKYLPKDMHFIFTFKILDNSFLSWVFAIFVIFLFIFARKTVSNIILKPLESLEKRLNSTIATYISNFCHIIKKPLEITTVFLGVYISSFILVESASLERLFTHLYRSFIIVILTWIFYRATDIIRTIADENIAKLNYELGSSLLKLLSTLFKLFLVVMGAIAVMNEWGFNTTQIIAAFSVLSVGISISAQDTIKNFWASLVLFFDKPFKLGDWITISGVDGVVEDIGIRSTKIRTFEKSLITVPNSVMANSNIQNWDRRPKRRVKMNLGLSYSTTTEQLKKILDDIRAYLRSNNKIDQEQILVYFTEFGSSSLNIMCYYFTKSIVWEEWLAAREETYLEFIRIVERNGATIAFPSQSIYIESIPDELNSALSKNKKER